MLVKLQDKRYSTATFISYLEGQEITKLPEVVSEELYQIK